MNNQARCKRSILQSCTYSTDLASLDDSSTVTWMTNPTSGNPKRMDCNGHIVLMRVDKSLADPTNPCSPLEGKVRKNKMKKEQESVVGPELTEARRGPSPLHPIPGADQLPADNVNEQTCRHGVVTKFTAKPMPVGNHHLDWNVCAPW